MKKGLIAGIIAVVAIAAIAGVFAMNNRDNTQTAVNSTDAGTATDLPAQSENNTTPPPTSEENTNKVAIENFAFSPAAITVKKGTTVTWTNNDSTSHTVTGDQTGGPDSELLGQGKSYSFTFNTVGTFAYHCAPHPQMTGKVTVTE